MPHHALDERRALAETLRCADPHAPTLCGDWQAAQLAAHLVLRERSALELAGRAPVQRWRRAAEHRIDELAATEPYGDLVDAVERGPSWRDLRWPLPVAPLWALPPVREAANLLEYLIHHEDVRRAADGWTPRPLPVDVQMAVWKRLPLAARMTLRTVPVGVEVAWPGHGEFRSARARRGGPVVRVSGEPVELALFTSGRIAHARVEYAGDPADVARVRGAEIAL
jgi:uncharacterized protein (TIGR03085 family)